ncbi:PAS/PAC sensor signal transduction histidine kinase [Solidesulfovibrio fructosivorans JJ]]|uniref:histidine kinase n=1 Tax=Solidesulfovibrio fructosivorans JJ] TaxID=596151 RepID=E1JRY5_SOLFR|nr:PAS domain S-box protein [Solidesulfovibrio fructosivorans]EFL52754.1 PAS/PAC sensor signal transduction histidine kinase [Solidesulfovibrio fructosivorans JJ]]
MTPASPIRLARSLASEGPRALLDEPTRTLVERLPEGVAVLDASRVFVRGNASGRNLLEVPGAACHRVIFGRNARCPGCPCDGGDTPVQGARAACAPLAGDGGASAGAVCVFSPAVGTFDPGRLAVAVECAFAAVFVVDRDFRFLYINRAFERWYGRRRRELLSRPMADCMDAEAFARFRATALEVFDRGAMREEEVRRTVDGRERNFQTTLLPLVGEDGVVDAVCCLFTEITSHRRAQRELDASRRRYQAIVEDQTELVVRLDARLRRVFVNRAVARIAGRPVEDMLGSLFLEDVPEGEGLRERILALTPRAPVVDVRHMLTLPDGHQRCLNWTVRAIFDEAGRVGEYQAMGRDVTAYWRMERELIRSEAKYRDIFEHSAEGIFQFDPDGAMAACNPALARILGFASPEEVLLEQGDLFSRIQARQQDRLEFLRLLAQHGRVFDFEMQVVRRDGRAVWVSINARAVLDESGRLQRVEGAARDITDRKRAEEERMLLVSAVDQSAEGLVIVSRDFRLEYANPAFAQIVGGQGGAGGLDLERHLGIFLGESVRKMLGLGLRWSGRLRLPRSDGEEGVAETLISPVRDAAGQITNHIMLVRDMTYEMGLEKRLRQVEKLEAIGVLAGGVAHDFNNILTPILLNTEMILADIPWKDPLRKPLADVVRASERARDLVRQLLTFSRQGELTVGPLPLNPLVKETLKLARGMIEKRVEIRQRVSELALTIEADPAQIHQVLMNLCLNAAQAMPEGGVLEVGLLAIPEPPRPLGPCLAAGTPLTELPPGPYAKLWVSDTGHGMTADICDRIFEPFFTTKKPGQGTGMGLAAVHGIVKGCGGAVLVTSAVGRGSLFEVFFPLIPRPGSEKGQLMGTSSSS